MSYSNSCIVKVHVLRNRPLQWRLISALITSTIVFSIAELIPQSLTVANASYNCLFNPNSTSGHCYGVLQWDGGVIGSTTSIYAVPITYNNGDEFLTIETWNVNSTTGYLVEVGEIRRQSDAPDTAWFWADFHYHPERQMNVYTRSIFGLIPNADFYSYIPVWIIRDFDTQYSAHVRSTQQEWVGTSTNNNLQPNEVQIGEELAGTNGGSAPRTYWTYNQWIDNNGVGQYQNNNGHPVAQASGNPPTADWLVYPANSSNGGTWYADCC